METVPFPIPPHVWCFPDFISTLFFSLSPLLPVSPYYFLIYSFLLLITNIYESLCVCICMFLQASLHGRLVQQHMHCHTYTMMTTSTANRGIGTCWSGLQPMREALRWWTEGMQRHGNCRGCHLRTAHSSGTRCLCLSPSASSTFCLRERLFLFCLSAQTLFRLVRLFSWEKKIVVLIKFLCLFDLGIMNRWDLLEVCSYTDKSNPYIYSFITFYIAHL